MRYYIVRYKHNSEPKTTVIRADSEDTLSRYFSFVRKKKILAATKTTRDTLRKRKFSAKDFRNVREVWFQDTF